MKNQFFAFAILCLWGCGQTEPSMAQNDSKSQKYENTLRQSFAKKKVLYVDNINGYIHVEGYSGDKVEVEVEQRFSADSPEKLAKVKADIQYKMEETADTIYLEAYNADCDCNRRRKSKSKHWKGEQGYQYEFNFKLKVPKEMITMLYTVNQGEIEVKNMEGEVYANHVNGGITLDNVSGVAEARTVNGEVKISLRQNPTKPSNIYTLNGNINIDCPVDFSADIQLKSFNGDFYTDYEFVKLPSAVTTTDKEKSNKKIYKVSSFSAIRIGKGGEPQQLETFNGNIYINKRK
jgi:DUF4097 and DUF4098 domain-containing protein YvlB